MAPGDKYAGTLAVDATPCPTPDLYEDDAGGLNDDAFQRASNLAPPGQPNHTFDKWSDKDWARFVAIPGYLYTITTTNLIPPFDPSGFYADTVVELYGSDGVTPVEGVDRNDDYGGTYASRVQWQATEAITVFVKVYNFNASVFGCNVGYDILFRLEPPRTPLSITKTAEDMNGGPLFGGDEILYQITVRNVLTVSQSSVMISDAVPGFTTYVAGSALVSQGNVSGPNPLVANVGSLLPGQIATLSFRVKVNADATGQRIRNTAQATSNLQTTPVIAGPVEPKPSGGLMQPGQQTLGIGKSGEELNGGLLYAGDEILFSVIVTNLLPVAQAGVVISDAIPAYTTYVAGSAQLSQGSVSGPNPLVASIGTLPARGNAKLTFRARVNDGAVNQTIKNTAQATSNLQTTPVIAGPVEPKPSGLVRQGRQALGIGKWAEDVNGPLLFPGDEILYRIAVTNLLTVTQFGIVISDAIPMYATYVPGSAQASQGGVSGPDPLALNVGSLPPGGSASLAFRVRVNANAARQVVRNTVRATSNEQTTPVVAGPVGPQPGGGYVEPFRLGISKTGEDLNGGRLYAGDEVLFTVVVSNLLPTAQAGVVITDFVPNYTTYKIGSAQVSQGSVSGPDPLVAAVGTLQAGQSAVLTFEVVVNDGAAGQVVRNTARAASPQQPTPVVAGPVEPQPGGGLVQAGRQALGITKVAEDVNGGQLAVGDEILYTLEVKNLLNHEPGGRGDHGCDTGQCQLRAGLGPGDAAGDVSRGRIHWWPMSAHCRGGRPPF